MYDFDIFWLIAAALGLFLALCGARIETAKAKCYYLIAVATFVGYCIAIINREEGVTNWDSVHYFWGAELSGIVVGIALMWIGHLVLERIRWIRTYGQHELPRTRLERPSVGQPTQERITYEHQVNILA